MPTIQGYSFSLKQIEQLVSASQSSEVTLSLWDKFKDLFIAGAKRAAVEEIFAQLQRASDGLPGGAAQKIERFYALMPMVKPEDRHRFSVQISQPTACHDGSSFKCTVSLSISGEVVGKAEFYEDKSLNSYRAVYTAEAIATIASHLNLPEAEAQSYIHDLCMRVSFPDREDILSIFNQFFDKYADAIMNHPIASRIANDAATLLFDVTAPLPIAGELQRMAKQDMQPGDILLLLDEPEHTTFTHGAIKAGQEISGLSVLRDNYGDSNLVHAVMWVKDPHNPARTQANGAGEPEISELRGGARRCAQNTALRRGHYVVYRPKDPAVAQIAAQIAMIWADGRDIKYSTPQAVKSVISNSTFGTAAEKQVIQYGKDAFEASPDWGLEGGFCSQFILAAMQAACIQLGKELPAALRVDANNTSVRTLEHFLKTDPEGFMRAGEITIEPEQVLYND